MSVSVFSTQPYWYNKARALSVLAQKWQGMDPDSVQMLMLESIADQCSLEGGKGVYIARNILAEYQLGETEYDDLAKCAVVTPRSESSEEHIVSVYPNPTNDHLFIMAPENSRSEYTITLHDVLGNEVQRQQFSGKETNFSMPLTNINNGLYILTIKDGNKSLLVQKVVKN